MLRQCRNLVKFSQNFKSKQPFAICPVSSTLLLNRCFYNSQETKQKKQQIEVDDKVNDEHKKRKLRVQKIYQEEQLLKQKEQQKEQIKQQENLAQPNQQNNQEYQDENQEKEHQDENQEKYQKNQQQNQYQRNEKSRYAPSLLNSFEYVSDKNKSTYLAMVEIFEERTVLRRNHVEFIYTALRHMPDFGVEHDLEVYKALINVMPKGKMIPTNIFQSEFMHYPKQQQCMIDLLEQMEDNGVIPDYEMEAMLLNIFGKRGHPLRKYWRMMYWMPKFKNASPWALPNPVPDDTLEIARLAVERMCSVDLRSQIKVYKTKEVKDAIDDTWIVSGMSLEQNQLMREHPKNKALYIEGPFLIWLRNRSINYFTLRADPDLEFLEKFKNQDDDTDDVSRLKTPFFGRLPRSKYQVGKCRSVHQQEDGTIFAICATGTSTKDSLLSWIRLLEANGNPILGEVPVLFRFISSIPDQRIQIEAGSGMNTNESLSTTKEFKNEKLDDDVR